MPKITFLLGLAGSGKSYLAKELQKETGAEIFEGIEGNPIIKGLMFQHLIKGGDCIVEEIAYCTPSGRERIINRISSFLPFYIEIEWICFENNLHDADWNVKNRAEKQDKVAEHLHINQQYHGLYVYPSGIKVKSIHRIEEKKAT